MNTCIKREFLVTEQKRFKTQCSTDNWMYWGREIAQLTMCLLGKPEDLSLILRPEVVHTCDLSARKPALTS